jgi:hypothetical protein
MKQIDYVGGILSTGGVLCFMMGMQWGAQAVGRLLTFAQPLLTSDPASLVELLCACSLHYRHCHDHRLLRLGSQVCQVPYGTQTDLREGEADYDLDSADYLLERWQLLCLAPILAYVDL